MFSLSMHYCSTVFTEFWSNNMILSVQVLVKAEGVKMLKVIRIVITVF